MSTLRPIPVPKGSLLAEFGEPSAYRDCFAREVSGDVSLPELIERFYCSWAFRPERAVLGLIGRGASSEDAKRLARGEVESFAAWNVIERRSATSGPEGRPPARRGGPAEVGSPEESLSERTRMPALEAQTNKYDEILLQDFQQATASWLSVRPGAGSTVLLFGSWVGKPDRGVVKALMPIHRWYSRVLLGGV